MKGHLWLLLDVDFILVMMLIDTWMRWIGDENNLFVFGSFDVRASVQFNDRRSCNWIWAWEVKVNNDCRRQINDCTTRSTHKHKTLYLCRPSLLRRSTEIITLNSQVKYSMSERQSTMNMCLHRPRTRSRLSSSQLHQQLSKSSPCWAIV